jgi:hypothetical protein
MKHVPIIAAMFLLGGFVSVFFMALGSDTGTLVAVIYNMIMWPVLLFMAFWYWAAWEKTQR